MRDATPWLAATRTTVAARRLRLRLLLLLWLLTLHSWDSALAQAETASASEDSDVEAVIASPEYKALIREGLLKYTRGYWPEARGFFLKAHELAPNARTLRGLALICYDSRHYVDAIDYAEQALVHPVQPLTEKMTDELKRLIEQAKNLVTYVQLVVRPATAQLRVDGKLATRRADGQLWLDPGDHELQLAAPDFGTETRHLQLQDGGELRFEVTLQPLTAAASAALASGAHDGEPRSSSALPWLLVGASAAIAVAGGVMIAVDQAGHEATGAWTPLGGALLGVGAAGAAVGLTWQFWPQGRKERPASARLRLGPNTVQISGSF